MTQQVYGLTRDLGDGTSCISWFRDKAIVDRITSGNDEDFLEEFTMNEGISETLTFPDGLDLEACGFSFSDDDVYETL